MKKLVVLLTFISTIGCSRNLNVHLPGAELPAGGINKELPVITKRTTDLSSQMEVMLKNQLEAKLTSVSKLVLYQNGNTWAPMLSLINESREFLYLNFLSFTCDERTEEMVKSLEKKASENVDVRLIVNKGFSLLSGKCLKRLETSGVKIAKVKSHASYIVNEKQELMIGSQSIARMFFNADGFNSLDRDMMIYARGLVASEAVRDFVSTWIENFPEENDLQKVFQKTQHWKDEGGKVRCVFLSQRPWQGLRDYENAIMAALKVNQQQVIFSGVKVNPRGSEIASLLKEKSLKGMSVDYIGNGYLSGNGELTMVFNEWINSLEQSSFSFVSPVVLGVKLWDNRRVSMENKKQYDKIMDKSNIKTWAYFNFIHHKVWLFDYPAFIIGSANFDDEKFSEVSDAGLLCFDGAIHDQLNSELQRDRQNSLQYQTKMTEVRK